MIENLLTNLHVYSEYFPFAGYEVLFLFSFLEAVAFIGVLLPGTMVTIMFGFFIYLGKFNFAIAFILCVLGALLGDYVSYYFGKRKGLEVKLGQKSIFRYLFLPEAGTFLLEQGGLAIVAGRFIGPLRGFIPFYLGAADEKEKVFFFYDMIGVFIWCTFYLGLGAIFGSSYELLRSVVDDLEFFIGLFAILIIVPLIVTSIFRKKIPGASIKEIKSKKL